MSEGDLLCCLTDRKLKYFKLKINTVLLKCLSPLLGFASMGTYCIVITNQYKRKQLLKRV